MVALIFLKETPFERVLIVQKHFSDWNFTTPIGTQLRAQFLKILSHSDHVFKNEWIKSAQN